MLNTKINIIVSFITSGVILVGIYCLNSIYVFVDGLGIGTLIAGILFFEFKCRYWGYRAYKKT